MALTRWTWVWASSRSLWWIGKSGMLQSSGLQKLDTTKWTELKGVLHTLAEHYFLHLQSQQHIIFKSFSDANFSSLFHSEGQVSFHQTPLDNKLRCSLYPKILKHFYKVPFTCKGKVLTVSSWGSGLCGGALFCQSYILNKTAKSLLALKCVFSEKGRKKANT